MKIPILKSIEIHSLRVAIIDETKSYSYSELERQSVQIAKMLKETNIQLEGSRIAVLLNPGFQFAAAALAVWRVGAIFVPLSVNSPDSAILYVLDDITASIILTDNNFELNISALSKRANAQLLNVENAQSAKVILQDILYKSDREALIIYTSGTSGKPKGVVISLGNLEAQMTILINAWQWSADDVILNILPLHHVHGLINALFCPLYAGAAVYFLPKFDTNVVWSLFKSDRINVFMAVPTIYVKLIADFDAADENEQLKRKEAISSFRMMVSGSAALPVKVLDKWKTMSGHILLERYGMTEIGMAISNPYKGERRAGFVGMPLPGVQVRLFDESTNLLIDNDEEAGEIQIKGPSVFKCYWNRSEVTANSFTKEGWFKTGDLAVRNNGYYKILGRISSDVIKSGGYKLSALEIEEQLREHPNIIDCAVVGIPDEEWGEKVAAAIVFKTELSLNFDSQLTQWLKERIAPYKIPRIWRFLKELPRNEMGKVIKNDLITIFNQKNDTSA